MGVNTLQMIAGLKFLQPTTLTYICIVSTNCKTGNCILAENRHELDFPGGPVAKNTPASLPSWLCGKKQTQKKTHLPMQETQVQSLFWEDLISPGTTNPGSHN